LGALEGRSQERFVLPSGAMVSGMRIYASVDGAPEVLALERFRVVQERRDRVRLLYSGAGDRAASAAAGITARLRTLFDEPMEVVAERASDLARETSGKLPAVRSLVRP